MKKNKGILLAIAVVTIGIIIGLVLNGNKSKTSPDTKHGSNTASGAVETNNVTIQNYMFSPMVIKVKAGETVTWTNKDSVHHNVLADTPSDSAPKGPLIGQGETYSFKFTKAGTYSFHCDPHPYMHGTVIVTE